MVLVVASKAWWSKSYALIWDIHGIRLGLDSSLLGSQFAPYQTRQTLGFQLWEIPRSSEDCSLAGHGLWGEASEKTGFLMSGATVQPIFLSGKWGKKWGSPFWDVSICVLNLSFYLCFIFDATIVEKCWESSAHVSSRDYYETRCRSPAAMNAGTPRRIGTRMLNMTLSE